MEVKKILKPGGLFITENPDFDASSRSFFGQCWWGHHLPRHLTHFSQKTMWMALTRVGFEVQSCKSCFRPGPIAWSFQNVLKERGHSPLLIKLLGIFNPFLSRS